MRRFNSFMFAGLVAGVGMMFTASLATAQTRSVSAQEYIQSTSPIAGGGSVTSISKPGQGVQTITSIAALPAASPQRPPVNTGFSPFNASPFATGTAAQSNTGTALASTSNARYAYPASSQPTTLMPAGNAQQTVAPNGPTYSNNSLFSVRDYQNQVLGATMNPRQVSKTSYRQGQNTVLATPNGQIHYPYQYGLTPPQSYQASYQPPAQDGTVPNLNIQMPGQTAPANQALTGAQGAATLQQAGAATQPVNFQNMPPGAYSGTNFSGRPKTYVDGQPLRNLFRYISP